MSPGPQQDGEPNTRFRQRANTTTNFPSFSWLRDRQPLPPSPANVTSPVSIMSLQCLIEALTPPNQPSLAHARSLALVLRTHLPTPQPAILTPILSSLCAAHSPVSLQVAGYEIISAFFENDEASTLETADRIAYLSLFLSPSVNHSQEIWEPRFRALRALTKYGTEISGLESPFLNVLKTWIHGAFEGLRLIKSMDSTERAGRERAIDVLTQFLSDVITNATVLSRLPDEELDGVLEFYANLVDDALGPAVQGPLRRREQSMPPLSTPDPPATIISTTSRVHHTHRRNPSSLSVTTPAQPVLSPVNTTKHPADIAASLYLRHLQSQLKLMSPTALDTILPLLFRALSFHATPLSPLSVTSSTTTSSTIEDRISETLNSLLCGPYASTCMITLKRHLFPPPAAGEDIAKWVQTSMGAHRTLRNYIRRSLCARLARAYISRTASVNYAPSGAPTFVHLERDLAERAWPKDDATAWDAGKLGRTLCKSVKGWVAFGAENEANVNRSGSEAILTEVAGTLKDVLEELESRDDNSIPDEEEATAVGEALYHLAGSVHRLKGLDGQLLTMPLSQPENAPSPFLRLLCSLLFSLLARDHKIYLNPPLSSTLLSIANHLTDIDMAALPDVMAQQHDLLPTSPDWLSNWEMIFTNPTLLSRARPLTRRGFMQSLQSVYDSVRDMPGYRRPLADLVYAFCERNVTDGDPLSDSVWQILAEEAVLRLEEVETGPATSIPLDVNIAVERFIALLSTTATEADIYEDCAPSTTPDISRNSSTPPMSSPNSPRAQSETSATLRDTGSALPSVISLFTSLTAGNTRSQSNAPQAADNHSVDSAMSSPASESASTTSRAASAVAGLIFIFSKLSFVPLRLSEANHTLSVQVFKIILDVVNKGKSPRARLTALQFMTRLRADRDHRVYLVDDRYDPDGHTRALAALIDRVAARTSERRQTAANIMEQSNIRRARARLPGNGDVPKLPQNQSAQSSSLSRSRSRATGRATNSATSTPTLRPRQALWQIPEQLMFTVHKTESPSEGLITFLPAEAEQHLLLPIYAWLSSIITILDQEKDWEILSYVLCHLPVQLANKHLFCGWDCAALMVKLLAMLATGLVNGQLASDVELWPQRLKLRDVHGLAYHTLSVLLSYKDSFDVQHRHWLVEVLEAGLNGQPSTIKCCIHALTLAAFELPASIKRCLSRVLEKLSQIMSDPHMAVHILGFLTVVSSLPALYSNFTENDFKMAFGVPLKYLQHHRPGTSPTGSWALSYHVRFASYYVIYTWFLAVKQHDRPRYVNYITRQLLLANEGRDEIDENAEICFDWLARNTYGSTDPRPTDSFLSDLVTSPALNSSENPSEPKAWVWGNSVVTIRTLSRFGWVEFVSRRPSGLTKFLCRVENVPIAKPGDLDPDPVSVPASLLMDYRPAVCHPPLSVEENHPPAVSQAHQAIVEDLLRSTEVTADPKTRPEKMPGYSWNSSGQSQRQKYFHVDPSYFALQLSAYPYHQHPPQTAPVTNKGALSTFIRNLDRIPVTDTHEVGIIYVAPGQTKEADILRNTHGSPAYARFLDGIGRLVRLDGKSGVYIGGLNSAEDGVYGYAWWDDFFQVLYHTATLMPSDPDDPNSNKKKRHIGNDYVRIVWNDSGIPYRFDTLKTQFQFVNVVIEPHSMGSIAAFSNIVHENEYFKVHVQRAASMPEFAPIGDFKLCSAATLPLYVRQLSLMSHWFASVFQRTNGDTDHVQLSTNWQSRLQAIKRFRNTIPAPDPPEFTSGVMAEVMQRDFTSVFY